MTITSNQLFGILVAHPYPGSVDLRMSGGTCCFTVEHVAVGYNINGWLALGRVIPADWTIPGDFLSDAARVHAEIDRVLGRIKAGDGEQKIVDSQPEQTFVSIDRYRELEAELKTVTKDRDTYKARQEYTQEILNQIWDATGWPEKFDEPDAIEYIKRLKSKADRAGLLSVVCRRLCGDENASIETVHKALDLFDDQQNALDYITQKVQCDSDPTSPHGLQTLGHTVAQLVKSLSDKTVSLEQTKQSLEWFTQEVEKLRFERDTERVGNKRLTETIEDLKRTTVKLPNEHTLRRLFNRHNTPDKYDDGTQIPTVERLLLTIENLCRNAECLERRFEELNAVSTRVNTESEDAHATLDEMGIPRWTTVGNHNERNLSLSARIRSVFQTHTKV